MVVEQEMTKRTDELIAKWIVLGEYDGPHQAWIKDHGTPVWALVGALPAHSFDGRAVAESYGLPWEAFQAAMAYYQRYKAFIDAKVLLNSSTYG
ncbi:MAG TPA: hypothetical protein VGR16_06205 [Thermomicrobiales bacterium]|nr:hypothetical protein [Thermomicrobiales bacterium]